MKKLLSLLMLIVFSNIYSQGAAYLQNAVNTPTSVANPSVFIGALPVPNGTFKVYIKDDIRWETYNINNFSTSVINLTSILYKPLTYVPTSSEVISALGYTPYDSTNPSGYINSYTETDPIWTAVAGNYRTKTQNDLLYQPIGSYITTETDPTVPAYAKSLTAFSVIKSSTDALYEPIFSKNTAFNKNFGTALGTVAEGNDSRILNGQTAFTWGNHASAGYITASSTSTLTNKSGNISQWTNDSGYLTSFTEVDPTVPAYSKSLTAFSVIKTSTDPLYEPVFVKNTAFNKNFGTTVGTIAEGNDTRIVNAVQNTRTLTINGTAFDLSANRSWTVGDVTTATLTSGLAGKENTITSGTNLQYWRGDKTWQTLNTTTVSEGTNLYYTDARARASISLTTTGSGAATYSGGVLNIPTPAANNYTAGTGINIASNVITNTAPDQTVTLTAGNRISITGTYPNFTISYVEPTINPGVVRTLNSNFTVSTTKQALVTYSVTCSVTNPLLIGTSTAMAFLEYSTNAGSTWQLPSQNGNSSGVGITVTLQLTNGQTGTLIGAIPANALVRIRTTTSGTASVTYVTGQETY